MKHRTTDPACVHHRPPTGWWSRWRFNRARGRSCRACRMEASRAVSRKDVTDIAVVLACRDALNTSVVFADELLAARTGQPRKVCERAMERAVRRGLIEYGVSLRTAWPTPKGMALLAESAH